MNRCSLDRYLTLGGAITQYAEFVGSFRCAVISIVDSGRARPEEVATLVPSSREAFGLPLVTAEGLILLARSGFFTGYDEVLLSAQEVPTGPPFLRETATAITGIAVGPNDYLAEHMPSGAECTLDSLVSAGYESDEELAWIRTSEYGVCLGDGGGLLSIYSHEFRPPWVSVRPANRT